MTCAKRTVSGYRTHSPNLSTLRPGVSDTGKGVRTCARAYVPHPMTCVKRTTAKFLTSNQVKLDSRLMSRA